MSRLPQGWRTLTLGDLASGGLFTDGDWVESKDQDSGGGVRLTQLADVGEGYFRNRSSRRLREDQAARLHCTFLEVNDILIARMPDPNGRACLAPKTIGRAVTAVDVAVLRIRDPSIDPRYIMWAINSPLFRARVVSLQSGTTRKRISRKNLAGLSLLVPTLAEQRRIVDILEDHLSRLDAAEVGIQRVLVRLLLLQEGSIASALSGAAVTGVRERIQLADVGTDDGDLKSLPSSWTWKRLGQLADVVGGITKDAGRETDAAAVEVPYLRVANVQRGRLDLTNVTTIRVSPAKVSQLRLLPGDVLMNEGGDRDKLARGWVWEGQIPTCIHQNHVFRARVRGQAIDPRLLSWAGNTLGARWAERNGKQSVNLASISMTKIRQMPIPVPPLEVQTEVVRDINQRLDACARMGSVCDAALAKSKALRKALLSAAFAGRLTGHRTDAEVVEAFAVM